MKKILSLLAAVGLCAGASTAQAQLVATYVGNVDLSVTLGAGVNPNHIAVDNTGATPILYVTTLRQGGGPANIDAYKIEDPLGTPVVTAFDTNDGDDDASDANPGTGVANSRGYAGVGVDAAGNVYVAWSGNGNDDSARLRRYDAGATALTGEYLFAQLNDRLGGIDVDADGDLVVGARIFSTATKTGHYDLTTSSTLSRTFASTPATPTAFNPRDVAYDNATGLVYINANGSLEAITPDTPAAPAAPAAPFQAGTTSVLQANTNNSFAGHGVAVGVLNTNGGPQTVIGYSPAQLAGEGINTFRIVDTSGVTLITLGTLDTSGTFTDGDLFRPIDAAFFTVSGTDYVAVTDTDLSDDHRVAIYSITDTTSVGDWTLLQ